MRLEATRWSLRFWFGVFRGLVAHPGCFLVGIPCFIPHPCVLVLLFLDAFGVGGICYCSWLFWCGSFLPSSSTCGSHFVFIDFVSVCNDVANHSIVWDRNFRGVSFRPFRMILNALSLGRRWPFVGYCDAVGSCLPD